MHGPFDVDKDRLGGRVGLLGSFKCIVDYRKINDYKKVILPHEYQLINV